MINIDTLDIINYCHANCLPFMNICRLPKKEAFSLARKMADENPDTTAFYRFADFHNYYPLRMKTDEYLFDLFVSLGGKPKEQHPLSFVLQGSEYLNNWFGNGAVNKIMLKNIPSEFISFTLGDSMSIFKKDGPQTPDRHGELTMYTKEMLSDIITDGFLSDAKNKYHYIEAQLWNDDFTTCVNCSQTA